MTRLLCATDLLPKSDRAIDRASILAGDLAAELSLLHVVSPTASERALEQSLQIAMARMKSRVRPPLWRRGTVPTVVVRTGNPARLICDTLEQEQADLLIVGPHERRNALDGLSGTIAERVLSARKCPLLLVRGDADVSYRDVLLALDLSAESALAVRAAEALVLRADAKATAMHVCEPPIRGMLPSSGATRTARAGQAQSLEALHDFLGRESADCERYDAFVEEGHPISAILRAVEIHQPQLLVIGTRAAGRMRRALLGSVASELLKEVAACDVLVVPRDSFPASMAATEQRARLSGT